jgi:alpha-beta hydrolase superfamily lysophospholipase
VPALVLKDELLDAQTMRVAGTAAYEGAEPGECLAAAALVRGTDLDSWHAAWTAAADRALALGEAQEAAGRTVSARQAFFRAAGYFRTAGTMLMGAPVDPRLAASCVRQTEAFRRGAVHLPLPPGIVEIPYENTTLPGYWFRADDDPAPHPVVILLGGYDGTAEELYFLNGAAALARGYHVLAFDGPGQGSALLRQGLVLRPDWENVITPVLDFALRQPGTDPARVALIGLSLGAFLAPRAASAEHRLAAVIADCGSFDLYAAAQQRIPGPLRAGLSRDDGVATAVLRSVLNSLARKPTAGWALRRGQLVHGVGSPVDYLRALRDYSLKDHAAKISCPVLVCNAEGDDISASAPELVSALTGPKDHLYFTEAEGAGGHCEPLGRVQYHARTFAWLDAIMKPGS